MIINGNQIIAEDGKVLTNGEIVAEVVYLGKADSVDNWQEIENPNDEFGIEIPAIDEEEIAED